MIKNKKGAMINESIVRFALFIAAIAMFLIIVKWLKGSTELLTDTPLDFQEQIKESQLQEEQLITIANEGKIYAEQHNYNSAASKYQELVNAPGSQNIVDSQRYYIAKSFFETGKYDDAMQHYRLFIENKPNAQQQMVDTAYSDLATIYIKKAMTQETEDLIKEYKQKYPDSSYYNTLAIKLTG
jgi:tetratricopeptide (TPR) repeat protein